MEDEKEVKHEGTQITGRTEGPSSSDDTDADLPLQDNKNRDIIEDSANGLDSVEVRGGQDGRNIRGFGGIDMDSKNGVIRMGDMDNSTMEVTEEGKANAAASIDQTKTAMVDVTTESSDRSGPDDYASADKVGVPNAQRAAKEQNDNDADDSDTADSDESQQNREDEVAETGTDLNNQPTY